MLWIADEQSEPVVFNAGGVPQVQILLAGTVDDSERTVFNEVCAQSDVPAEAVQDADGRTWVNITLRQWTTPRGVHQQLDAIQAMLDMAKGGQPPAEPSAPIVVEPYSFGSVADVQLIVGAWWLTGASNRFPPPPG